MRAQSPWSPRLAEGDGGPAERLAQALEEDILAGRLSADERLPAHRDLAWRLGIGVGSVTRAYAVLARRGLVQSTHGSGTFVAVQREQSERLFDLATNMPPPMFSDRALSRTLARLAQRVNPDLFNIYPPVAGHLEHRRIMAQWLAGVGVEATPDGLLLTSGAQQALNVALSVVRPHVALAVTEEQTYPGMLGAMRLANLPVRPAAMDAEGVLPAALEAILHHALPERAVVYVTPTMQNPTTATMGSTRRREIAALCRRFDALLIEDGVYVGAPEPDRPALMELVPERCFHVSSLSKILSPGLRIGTLIPPRAYLDACLPALLASSLMIAPLSYAMMAQWIENGTAESVRKALRAEAARRRALAVATLPDIVDAPPLGFHAWLPLPARDIARVTDRARRLGVTLPAPQAFQAGGECQRTGIRLALGNVPPHGLAIALRRVRAACAEEDEKVSRDTMPIY